MCNIEDNCGYELELGKRSKERVNNIGEVFTPQDIVNDILDLTKEEVARIDSKILEPSCGNGNFIVEILKRKLNTVFEAEKVRWERGLLAAISTIYGVDIMQDNIFETKERMLSIIRQYYQKYFNEEIPMKTEKNIKFIIDRNIMLGDSIEGIKFKVVGNRRKSNITKQDGELLVYDWKFNTDNTVDIRIYAFLNMALLLKEFHAIELENLYENSKI